MDNLTIREIERVCELKGKGDEKHILITEINMEDGTGTVYRMWGGIEDVKEWVEKNLYEGSDFRYEKQWYDSEQGNGWYEDVPELIEENTERNIELYILDHQSEWKKINVIQ